VARQLAGRTGTCLIAPDLRGRGRSAALPRPYGLVTHLTDLTVALDHLGVDRAVMAGHSMGAHVAARLSAEQPHRAAALVLIDGGLPRAAPIKASETEADDETPGRKAVQVARRIPRGLAHAPGVRARLGRRCRGLRPL
jgi:pimeloyl-ACP methyl ester carboxylesterase